jgi:hypothetical protein
MHRTQIYITQKERGSLTKLSKKTGKTKSELIREAIDKLIAEYVSVDWKQIFLSSSGIWKGRKDLPDFTLIRKDLDR